MSNTQYVFINKSEKPNKKELEKNVLDIGYRIDIDEGWDDSDWCGFLPCKINELEAGCEVSFGSITEFTEDIEDEEELGEFQELTKNKDYFIELSWSSDYLGGATATLIAAVFVKYYEAVSSYDCEEPDTLEELLNSVTWHIEEYKKEEKK